MVVCLETRSEQEDFRCRSDKMVSVIGEVVVVVLIVDDAVTVLLVILSRESKSDIHMQRSMLCKERRSSWKRLGDDDDMDHIRCFESCYSQPSYPINDFSNTK